MLLDLFSDLTESTATPVDGDMNGLPVHPCPCGCGHFWLSPDGWRCSDCHPMPVGVFIGDTLTIKSSKPLPVTEITRTDLESWHPATIRGIPLSVILDQADPSDYADLADGDMLEAFAASLIATRTLDPSQYRETPRESARRPLVRCCDCAHHVPSKTDPKHGIGGCAVDSPALLRSAPWPKTERRCDKFEAREVVQ